MIKNEFYMVTFKNGEVRRFRYLRKVKMDDGSYKFCFLSPVDGSEIAIHRTTIQSIEKSIGQHA